MVAHDDLPYNKMEFDPATSQETLKVRLLYLKK